jgi:hypothetical protein
MKIHLKKAIRKSPKKISTNQTARIFRIKAATRPQETALPKVRPSATAPRRSIIMGG